MLKREYPVKRTRMEVSTEISAGPHLATSAQQRPTGTLFIGRDERQIAQFRLDGFTFSRLAPYPEWESVREEALRLWRAYRVLAPDARVTRVAVRYVNRLKLPLPVGDLGDYLTLRPELPSEVGGISGFFVHLEIPQPDISAMLIINEAIAEPPTEQRLAVLLDFDLFRDTALPGNDEAVALEAGGHAIEALPAQFLHFQQSGFLQNSQVLGGVVFRDSQSVCDCAYAELLLEKKAHDPQAIHLAQRLHHGHAL